MNRAILAILWLPVSALSVERKEVDPMLSRAASARGDAYLELRNGIIGLGKEGLVSLALAARDDSLTWQQRLVARVCYARVARQDDIQALRAHDWWAYPPYRGIPRPGYRYVSAAGAASEMGPYVVTNCLRFGLWYYYVELTWKRTREGARLTRPDPHFMAAWPGWCREALKGQPEESYLVQAAIDRLGGEEALADREDLALYRALVSMRLSDAVPVLVERYDVYFSREVSSSEVYPGSRLLTYRALFETITRFADSRHFALLDVFVSDRPELAPLKGRLAEVRVRPPPPPEPEPPFRLGTTHVAIP
jgi:hypothetical protein